MARAADIEVLRGDVMEHDRSTSVVERSYTLRRFARLGCDACHGGLVTASAICGADSVTHVSLPLVLLTLFADCPRVFLKTVIPL